MRRASALLALMLTVPPLFAAGPAVPSINACALLDAQQIEQVIGQAVDAGTRHDAGIESNGAWSSSCIWKIVPASGEPAAAKRGFVILNAMQWPLGSGRAHEFLDSFHEAAAQGVLARPPSPRRFGDDALWWGDGLAVRKGDVSFGLSVHVPRSPSTQPGAAEERLAPLILKKLEGRAAQLRRPHSVRS